MDAKHYNSGARHDMKNISKYLWIFVLAVACLLAYKFLFDYDSIISRIGRIIRPLQPFVWGFAIAYCINIPVVWLEKKLNTLKARRFKVKWADKLAAGKGVTLIIAWINKSARLLSILITYTVIAFITVFGLSRLIPMVYDSAQQLIELIPGYVEEGLLAAKKLPIPKEIGIDINSYIDPLLESKSWQTLIPDLDFNFSDSFQYATQYAASIFSVFFRGILTFVSSVYFLLEYNTIKGFVKRIIGIIHSTHTRDAALKYVNLIDTSFRQFLSCQFLDSLILCMITMVEFTFLGSPYAVVLGIMLGAANIIPYFGSIFGSVAAVVITGFTNDFKTALITGVVLLITQQFDGNFINPKIMGKSFSVSPVLVIIGISVGGAIGGITGMVLAIPVVNVLKTILEEYMQSRELIERAG